MKKPNITWPKLISIYNLLCTIGSICLAFLWLYRFSLQNLSCEIDIKNFFQSDKDVQPAFSVCVIDPELDTKLRNIGFNKSIYIKFLQGKYMHENLRLVDFSNIRFNWSHYFYKQPSASLVSDDGESLGRVPMSRHWWFYTSFIGLQANNKYLTDCIALEPLVRNVENIKMWLNSSIFEQGIRPSTGYKFRVFLHYPGQIIRSYSTLKALWDEVDNQTSYIMRFRISNVQVLERYPTRHQWCIDDWKSYDRIAFETKMQKISCQSPYHYIYGLNHSICSTKEKMKNSLLYPSNRKIRMFSFPCRSIEHIQYTYTESIGKKLPIGVTQMNFHYMTYYKETKQRILIDFEVRKYIKVLFKIGVNHESSGFSSINVIYYFRFYLEMLEVQLE